VKSFTTLYEALDATTSTNAKLAALARYVRDAIAGGEDARADAAWAIFFLGGQRLKRLLSWGLLRAWTLEATGLPEWIFDESYGDVGDLAELCALLTDTMAHAPDTVDLPLHKWIEERILPLGEMPEPAQRAAVLSWWSELPPRERYVLNKLLTGELRVGVSATLVVRGVAQAAELPSEIIAQRLMGEWRPSAERFTALVAPEGDPGHPADASRPYPFSLASPLDEPPEALGDRAEWIAEWKWDGIRCQLLRRGDDVYLWSRGEELVTDRFPEITGAAASLPAGVVLDGEAMAWKDGAPLPFSIMQRRIGRRVLGPKILAEAPVVYVAFDLLEQNGADLRARPLDDRRAALTRLIDGAADARLVLSPTVDAESWEALAALRRESRQRHVEGIMLKRRASPYRTGRKRGDWWKWKIDPYTIDAVLMYAQAGSGRRASLFTDYTFGVWRDRDDGKRELVAIAKAYSGLDHAEIDELDKWIRRHTTERHGPVRVVEPEHVFELAFEGIAPSPRHRAGIAVRFPRMARWRRDKRPEDADTLATVRALLEATR
jgi:DNA ligase-1